MTQRVTLAWRLFRDPRVPLLPKVIPPLGIVYAISPVDLIPDWLLGPGHLDDLTVAVLSVLVFIWACPRRLVSEHRRMMAGFGSQGRAGGRDATEAHPQDVVDVEARVVDGDTTRRRKSRPR